MGRTVSPTGRMPFMHGPRECNGFKTSHNGYTLVWRRCHRTPLPFLNFICARVRNTTIGVFLIVIVMSQHRVRISNTQYPVHNGETCSSFPHGWERSRHSLFQDAIPSFA